MTALSTLIMALFGLSLPMMMIGNPLTYGFAVFGLLLAFGLPQVRDAAGINATLAGLWRSKLVWAMVALLLVLYVGTVGAIRPEYSIRHWGMAASLAGVMALLCHVFSRLSAAERAKFVVWLVWGVQGMYALAFVIMATEPYAFPRGWYGEKPWTETHLRFYSSVLAVVLPFCWMVWLKPVRDGAIDLTQKAYRNGILWVCSSFVLVLVCEGRSGWLGAVASALVWLLMMKRYHGLRLPKVAHSVGLAVGTLALSGVLYFMLYGKASIEERVGVTIPDRGLGGGRLDIWHLAYQHVFDQPWFGIGMNSFRFLPGADYHPHNFVLQLWLETGIIGMMLAFTVLVLMTRRLFVRGKADAVGVAGLAALAGFVVCALTNKSIFNPEWLVVLMVPMAYALTKARDGVDVVPGDTVSRAAAKVKRGTNIASAQVAAAGASGKVDAAKPVHPSVGAKNLKVKDPKVKAGKAHKRKKGRR